MKHAAFLKGSSSFTGFLWIGDPHLTSTRIGRRTDDMMEAGISKLSFLAGVCTQEKLRPLIGGDLLDRPNENKLELLTKLTRTAKQFPCVPFTLGSNHDLTLGQALDKDTMQLLMLNDTVRCLLEPQLIVKEKYPCMNGEDTLTVAVYGVPYGHAIPDSIESDADVTILMTHHDLAIGSSYPGAIPLKEIKGVDIVINGHMHGYKKPARHGMTLWCNPGNIEPLSVDLRDHVPRAWRFDVDHYLANREDPLLPVDIPYEKDVFDLRGLNLVSADSLEAVEAQFEDKVATVSDLLENSAFAEAIAAAVGDDEAGMTDDATVLLSDIQSLIDGEQITPAAQTYLLSIYQAVRLEHQAELNNAV